MTTAYPPLGKLDGWHTLARLYVRGFDGKAVEGAASFPVFGKGAGVDLPPCASPSCCEPGRDFGLISNGRPVRTTRPFE